MKVTISKMFDFDAAHRLTEVPPDHKCHRLHGHTYRFEVFCRGLVGLRGMVCDYAELSAAWSEVHDLVDHRYLNEIPGLENPTTEVLTPWMFDKLVGAMGDLADLVSKVRVYESATTFCEVTAADYLQWVREQRAKEGASQ